MKMTGLKRRQVARIFPLLKPWGAVRVDGCHWAVPDTKNARESIAAYKRQRPKRFKYPISTRAAQEYEIASRALLRFQRAIRGCGWIKQGSNPYTLQIYRLVEVTLRQFEKIINS